MKVKRPVVMLCAGKGNRLMELGQEIPKSLVPINGAPIISYVIEYWRQFATGFIFVVGYKKDQLISYIQGLRLDVPVIFVEQERPLGIAHAVSYAEKYIDGEFAVVLGDCMCKGEFKFPKGFRQGVGVWQTDNSEYIKKSYSIEIEGDFIKRVVEKPVQLVNDLCGLGYYFFEKKAFDYIRNTPPSALRNEIEITDVIQRMIDGAEKIAPVFFSGEYINVGSKEDIAAASGIFKK